MEQRNVLRHHGNRLAQALLRDPRDILAVDRDAAVLDVVEPLQQNEQAGFSAAGLTDQPDPLSRLDAKAEFLEHAKSAGIAKRDVVEGNRRAALDQRLGLRVVAQFVRKQQGGDRFGQPGDMLGDIDQRHREIARRAQDGKSQRTDQHDVAGGGAAALPKHDGPGQQRDRQHDGHCGVGEPQLFEITQAASPRRQFPVDGGVKPVVLEAEAAKRPHQRHVVDDIDHLAVDGCGLVREVVVQRLAGGGQAKHRDHHAAGDRRSGLPPSAG